MNIKVLGGGCCKCENLLEAVKEAVAEKGGDAEIENTSPTWPESWNTAL